MWHFSFDSSQVGLEPCPGQMSILFFPSLGDCIPISSFLDRASSRIMWLPSQHGWTPNTIIPMTWPLCYTGHLFSKSTQFRHGGLFHVWVPLFLQEDWSASPRWISNINGTFETMNPEAPCQSISYFLSLFSSLFNLYHKVHRSMVL